MGNRTAQRASNCKPRVEVEALGLVQLCNAMGHGSGSSSHCTGYVCERDVEGSEQTGTCQTRRLAAGTIPPSRVTRYIAAIGLTKSLKDRHGLIPGIAGDSVCLPSNKGQVLCYRIWKAASLYDATRLSHRTSVTTALGLHLHT